MTAASSRRSAKEHPVTTTIDVTPHSDEPRRDEEQHQSSAGALATSQGTFSAFLAPLTQDTFKQVATEIEGKLRVVNQTLSMLDSLLDAQGFDAILDEMLRSVTAKTGELLAADRTTIFVKDEDRNQLWSIVAEDKSDKPIEIRIPDDRGSIVAEVATTKQVINIPYDVFDDPRSAGSREQFKRTGYRTYTMLALPLLNEQGELVAVVQLLNKLKLEYDTNAPLEEKIERNGFSEEDERVFEEFAPSIRLIMESSRSLRRATQRQRAAQALIAATNSLSKSSLDLEETLKKVMDEAKHLMNADRSTLWLIDRDRNDLWTKLPINSTLDEVRIALDMNSFEGQVALTGEALNIGFDLYDHAGSDTSKETDQRTGYRTCSLLCMPVFADNELIGVTQLVNKKKQGEFPPYDPADWPQAPECWKASFDRTDQEFMKVFNIQAGVALQNAKLFATVKQQEQMQRDILRSLSDGVISTDKQGRIIAANESAKELLGWDENVRIKGRVIHEVIQIQDKDNPNTNKFAEWFNDALRGEAPEQYYPDRNLLSKGTEQKRSVNLSINSIADAADETKIRAALMVMQDISDEKRLKSTMYRYMTQELAEELLKLDDAKLGGDRKEVSILFSDIRSYTSLTEGLEAEEVVNMLNKYFESMVEVIFNYKGTLDKYIGDAIMAVFGTPLPLQDHAWRAVQTALEMRNRLDEFNKRRRHENKQEIQIDIGISSGEVISGNIGSSKRMEFTVIGDPVSLSSDLKSLTSEYGCPIILSESTYKQCSDHIWVRELDKIQMGGYCAPIYQLISKRNASLDLATEKFLERYNTGRFLYYERNFKKAIPYFEAAKQIQPTDKAVEIYLVRARRYQNNPPDDSWNGMETKAAKQ